MNPRQPSKAIDIPFKNTSPKKPSSCAQSFYVGSPHENSFTLFQGNLERRGWSSGKKSLKIETELEKIACPFPSLTKVGQ